MGSSTAAAWRASALLALLLAACGRDGGEQARPGIPVETVRAELGTLRERVRGIGTLRAVETVELRAEVPGTIRSLHFQEGGFVQQGQALYTLDDRKLSHELEAREAALAQARAGLVETRARHVRAEQLFKSSNLSETDYDRAATALKQAEGAVSQAEAMVQLAREQRRDAEIVAPLSGPISESLVDVGDYVRVGDELATLYRVDPLEISLRIPERFAGRVQVGQPLEVEADSRPGEAFQGEVSFVSPAVDETTRDLLVKARIANPDGALRPGGFATALVTVQEHAANPVVPEQALVASRDGYRVFVVRDGIAELRPVRIGVREPGRVEIREGVSAGDVVVRSGQIHLAPGMAVAPSNGPSGGVAAPAKPEPQAREAAP